MTKCAGKLTPHASVAVAINTYKEANLPETNAPSLSITAPVFSAQ